MLLVADTTIEGRPAMSDKAGEMNIAAVAIAIVKARRTRFFIFINRLSAKGTDGVMKPSHCAFHSSLLSVILTLQDAGILQNPRR